MRSGERVISLSILIGIRFQQARRKKERKIIISKEE